MNRKRLGYVLMAVSVVAVLAFRLWPDAELSSPATEVQADFKAEGNCVLEPGSVRERTDSDHGLLHERRDSASKSPVPSIMPSDRREPLPVIRASEIERTSGGEDPLLKRRMDREAYPPGRRLAVPAGGSVRDYVKSSLTRFADWREKQPWEKGGSPSRYRDPQDELAELAMGNSEVLDALIASAERGESPSEAGVALVILGRLPLDRAREFLISLSRSNRDAAARALAIRSLGQDGGLNVDHEILGSPPLLEPVMGPVTDSLALNEIMRAAEEDPDPQVRKTAVHLLSHSQGDASHPASTLGNREVEAIPAFERVTRLLFDLSRLDSAPDVRESALEALQFAPPSSISVGELVETALAEKDPRALQRAIKALGNQALGTSVPEDVYARLRSSDDWTIRGSALGLLEYMPNSEERINLAVEAALSDPQPDVRDAGQKVALSLTKEMRRKVDILRDLLDRCPPDDKSLRRHLITSLWEDRSWKGLTPVEASTEPEAAQLLADLRRRYPKSP